MRYWGVFGLAVLFFCGMADVRGSEFTSPKGFAITYPTGWRAVPLDKLAQMESGAAHIDAMICKRGDGKFIDNLNVIVMPQPIPIEANIGEKLIALVKGQMEAGGKKLKDMKSQRTDVGGIKAIALAFEIEQPGSDDSMRNWQVYIPGAKQTYIVTCGALKSRWADRWPIFKEMIDTMRIDIAVANDKALSPQQIEERVLRELSAGHQAEADDFLESQIQRFPEVMQVISLLLRCDDKAAKKILNTRCDHFRNSQRVFFLLGACTRSRFDKLAAFHVFRAVNAMNPHTPAGECALHVCAMDSNQLRQGGPKRVDEEFQAFTKLADANPDDVIIRWMLAVQCRTWDRNAEGVVQYKKILEKWNPGPVLVHQTYANLLDELERYDEALVERRKAVEMEPASWSYDGLGHTLGKLRRFAESYEAHAKAVELDPNAANYWANWASTLRGDGKWDEAIEKCKRTIQLDPQYWRALWVWADCLEAQGKKAAALQKYKDAIALEPGHLILKAKIDALEKELRK